MHQEIKSHGTEPVRYYEGFIMNKSFRDWLKSCPIEYNWQMNQITKDRGTYTFVLEEDEE